MTVVSRTKNLATGSGVLIALMLVLAPGGLAQANAVGEAGGQAVAEAESSYHADASGAEDAANENQQDTREDAADKLRDSGDAYHDAYAEANAESNADVDRPTCETCRDHVNELEQEGSGSFETAHHAEEAADVENAYVDAGADAEATAKGEAWYHELFNGVSDAFAKVDGLFEQETQAHEQASAQAEQSLDTEQGVREQAASTLEGEQNVSSPVQPSTEGQASGQHASEAASSMVTEAETPN